MRRQTLFLAERLVKNTLTRRRWKILVLTLSNGERLPVLVDDRTWIPARYASRWLLPRRYRAASSTLKNNLSIISRLYQWAQKIRSFDLDDYFDKSQYICAQDVDSIAAFVRCSTTSGGKQVQPDTFNKYLQTLSEFLI